MQLATKSLPDNLNQLKALLLKERSASAEREDNLKQQIHSLLEALRLEKHRSYGSSSEKSPDQSELFDEADAGVDEIVIEAQKAQPKGKAGKADMAIGFISKLYAVEKQTRQSDVATRHRLRQQVSVPVLQQFRSWLLKSQQQVPPKTALGKAVNYALEYWPELSLYTEHGAWPIDNNPAENAIRPFVIGRKAWLFSNSQRGAQASADLYGLIETAKANRKEPYSYLSWLFERLPGADMDNVESLMPWNMPD